MAIFTGCERRQYYRTQADEEVNCIIQQSSEDPRWALGGVNVMMDPRSRYYDPYDPDRPPMPIDDPESNKFLYCVDGMAGHPFWEYDGIRPEMENPDWRLRMTEYVPVNEYGQIVLNRESALRLAYINSTEFQGQLETLYLSALDVSTERFRFDTQFFGGTGTRYNHNGDLTPGGETNTLRQDTDAQLNRQFATAGTLLVTFANSFVWQFTGPDTNTAFSLLGFTFAQPLLRNGGRIIALEQLTIVERALLSNLRAFERYRQGFYTDIVVGNAGVGRLQRRGGFFGGTGLSGFTGTGAGGIGGVGSGTFGFGGGAGGGVGGGAAGTGLAGGGAGNVGGFLGLLQSLQEFRNAQDSFDLQVRTLSVLEAYNEAGQIDLVQVDQFRQSIETQRAQLLQAENGLQNSIEGYLTGTLSLPPDLPVDLDDEFIRPFQLVADDFTDYQNEFNGAQDQLAVFADPDPNDPLTQLSEENLVRVLDIVEERRANVDNFLAGISDELDRLNEISAERQRFMATEEQADFERDLAKLAQDLEDLSGKARDSQPELQVIRDTLGMVENDDVLSELLVWLRDFQFTLQEVALLQARIRVETITLTPIQLDSESAFRIAMSYRYDVMNNRASIVDTWRLIAFNANRLMSDLSVRLDGDLGTTGNNALKFEGGTGSLSARLEWDAPFTRLLERNNYRQALIDYQSSRRQYIQFTDGVNSGLRATLRSLEQLRLNLEIQRRAVVIAIRRVDATQQELEEPLPVPVPGQPAPQRGATTAQNLLSALEDLRNTQNNFMSVWLNYYATRMALMRDLGVMELDEEGRWIDETIDFEFYLNNLQPDYLPPMLPQEWIDAGFSDEMPEQLPQQQLAPQPELNDGAPLPNGSQIDRRGRGTPFVRYELGRPKAGLGTPNWGGQPATAIAQRTNPAGMPTREGPQAAIAQVDHEAETEKQGSRYNLLDRLPFKSIFGEGAVLGPREADRRSRTVR